MNINDCFKILKLNDGCSIEDIKKSYRTLAKVYHPDINKNVDKRLFELLNESYNFMLDNYKIPIIGKPEIKKEVKKNIIQNYYFTIPLLHVQHKAYIGLPYEDVIDEDIHINISNEHLPTFSFNINKYTKIPTTINIKNMPNRVLFMHITSDFKGYW